MVERTATVTGGKRATTLSKLLAPQRQRNGAFLTIKGITEEQTDECLATQMSDKQEHHELEKRL